MERALARERVAMHGSGGSQEAKTKRKIGSYILFHPEDHFRGFCLLNRGAERGDGDRAVIFSFQKGEPFPLATGSKVL